MIKKRSRCFLAGLMAMLLVGCGVFDDDNDAAAPVDPAQLIDYPKLSSGSYDLTQFITSADEIDVATVKAFCGTDGETTLVLFGDDTETVTDMVIGEMTDGTLTWRWVSGNVPAPDTVSYGTSSASGAADIAAADLAGEYHALVADGVVASFDIDAAGTITPVGAGAQLSGTGSESTLFGAVDLTVSLSDAGDLSGDYAGIVYSDTEDAPAAAHLVLVNTATDALIDLLAYDR